MDLLVEKLDGSRYYLSQYKVLVTDFEESAPSVTRNNMQLDQRNGNIDFGGWHKDKTINITGYYRADDMDEEETLRENLYALLSDPDGYYITQLKTTPNVAMERPGQTSGGYYDKLSDYPSHKRFLVYTEAPEMELVGNVNGTLLYKLTAEFKTMKLPYGESVQQNVDVKPEDGKTPYLHMAYSWSADGTDRFMTVYPGENLLQCKDIKAHRYDGFTPPTTSKSFVFTASDSAQGPYFWNDSIKPNTHYVMSFDITYLAGEGIAILGGHSGAFTNNAADYVLIDGNKSASTWQTSGGIAPFKLGKVYSIEVGFTTLPDLSKSAPPKGFFIQPIRFGDGSNWQVKIENWRINEGTLASPYVPNATEDPLNAYPIYRGEYTDYTEADSTDPSKYTWALIKGEDGNDELSRYNKWYFDTYYSIKNLAIPYSGTVPCNQLEQGFAVEFTAKESASSLSFTIDENELTYSGTVASGDVFLFSGFSYTQNGLSIVSKTNKAYFVLKPDKPNRITCNVHGTVRIICFQNLYA